MKIHNVKAEERKGDQQAWMVFGCIDHFGRVNKSYPYYPDIMNMVTCRWNDEHRCFVAFTYHFNLNKW